jgi:hypothetical protein
MPARTIGDCSRKYKTHPLLRRCRRGVRETSSQVERRPHHVLRFFESDHPIRPSFSIRVLFSSILPPRYPEISDRRRGWRARISSMPVSDVRIVCSQKALTRAPLPCQSIVETLLLVPLSTPSAAAPPLEVHSFASEDLHTRQRPLHARIRADGIQPGIHPGGSQHR